MRPDIMPISATPPLGMSVIYRSRTGDYDVPAIVTATVDTLNPEGVEAGHIPALSEPHCVHLTCFTAGKPGLRRGAEDFKVESEHPVSENVAGCYQEWDIPRSGSFIAPTEGDEPPPGSWRPMEQL